MPIACDDDALSTDVSASANCVSSMFCTVYDTVTESVPAGEMSVMITSEANTSSWSATVSVKAVVKTSFSACASLTPVTCCSTSKTVWSTASGCVTVTSTVISASAASTDASG